MIDELEEKNTRLALALRRERFSKQKWKDLVVDLREQLRKKEVAEEAVRQTAKCRTSETYDFRLLLNLPRRISQSL